MVQVHRPPLLFPPSGDSMMVLEIFVILRKRRSDLILDSRAPLNSNLIMLFILLEEQAACEWPYLKKFVWWNQSEIKP